MTVNLNTPRLDNGAPLQAAELSNVIGYGRWADQTPMAAECCTDEGAEPAPKRTARVQPAGVALIVLFLLSASLVGYVLLTGWRLATAGF